MVIRSHKPQALPLESRIGLKGQVTIPADLREELGLHPRDIVTFERDGDSIVLRARVSKFSRWYGIAFPPRSMDEQELKDEIARVVAEEATGEER